MCGELTVANRPLHCMHTALRSGLICCCCDLWFQSCTPSSVGKAAGVVCPCTSPCHGLRHARAVLALHMAARHRGKHLMGVCDSSAACNARFEVACMVLVRPLCGMHTAAGRKHLRGWASWQQRCLYNNTYMLSCSCVLSCVCMCMCAAVFAQCMWQNRRGAAVAAPHTPPEGHKWAVILQDPLARLPHCRGHVVELVALA